MNGEGCVSNKRAFSILTAITALLSGCRGGDKTPHKPAETHSQWFASFAEGQSKTVRFDSQTYLDSLTFRQRNEQMRDWALAYVVAVHAASVSEFAQTLGPFEVRRVEDLTSPYQQRGALRWCSLPNGDILALLPEDGVTVREQRLGALIDAITYTRDASHARIHVFEYRIDPDDPVVLITRLASEPVSSWWTQARGYFSAQISSAADLNAFLESADDLTEVRFEDGKLVLSGRAGLFHNEHARFRLANAAEIRQSDARWRVPVARINRAVADFNARYGHISGTREEVDRISAEADRDKAAIEKLKQAEEQRTDLRTVSGFSLDPKPDGAASPAYQEARYDGDLQGTETGMVLFYTDLNAKLWALNIGGSFPWVISGFQPQTVLALSERDLANVRANPWTRIWFGPRLDRFQHESSRLRLAPVAVKVFAKSFAKPGTREGAPNPASSAFVNWWNAHYEEVSRWEPEYERLNQIIKWSLVFEWFERYHSQSAALDFLDQQTVRRDRWFPEWAHEQGSNLKFRRWEDVRFDARGSRGPNESLGILSSKPVRNANWERVIVGGVSLAGATDLDDSQKQKPTVQNWTVRREGGSLRVDSSNGRTLFARNADQAMIVSVSKRSSDRMEFRLDSDTVTALIDQQQQPSVPQNRPAAEMGANTGSKTPTGGQQPIRRIDLGGDLTGQFLDRVTRLQRDDHLDQNAPVYYEVPEMKERDFDKAMISILQERPLTDFGARFSVILEIPAPPLPWAIQAEGKTYVRAEGDPEKPFHGRVTIAELKSR